MSQLAKYNGNFISFLEGGINEWEGIQANAFSGINELSIQGGAIFAVLPSPDNQAHVKVKGEDVSIQKSGDQLIIKAESRNSVTFSRNGGVVISGGNISMINGRIFVDGKEVSPSDNGVSEQPKVLVLLPSVINFDGDLDTCGVFASKVPFSKARLSVSGSAEVGLAARAIKGKLSGSAEAYFVVKDGDLDLTISGSSSVRAKGSFSSVDITASGSSEFLTEGECKGGYRASASGCGKIKHRGSIRGQRRERTSGCGEIDI
jgi:hypothetical protein